ncbi:hypothetical protein GQ53DRAFT_719195 [Thozetella sp. PMI_491]|nr:hypothetical protein GQ53DRAFT_719195 [Thozetella sp. PMI_491]
MSATNRSSRLGHRKSRSGCRKCRERRVKCDEVQPHSEEPLDNLPESTTRRLLELRLLQNWYASMIDVFPLPAPQSWRDIFSKAIPSEAMKHSNLLYILLAVSATNLLRSEPSNFELSRARQSYMVSAMREQRRMVDSMSPDNAEPVSLAAMLILLNAFAMMQERSLEPYVPPNEWLAMGKGTRAVLWMSVQPIRKSGGAEGGASIGLLGLAASSPRFGLDESYFEPGLRENFAGVLAQDLPSGDIWDYETREAYEKTLSYVGSVQKAIRGGEPVYAVAKRIQAFPVVIPRQFSDLVAEQRPRALVVLAHYFAVVSQVSGIWWLDSRADGAEPMPKREVLAIRAALPEEWQGQMVWPLDMVGQP